MAEVIAMASTSVLVLSDPAEHTSEVPSLAELVAEPDLEAKLTPGDSGGHVVAGLGLDRALVPPVHRATLAATMKRLQERFDVVLVHASTPSRSLAGRLIGSLGGTTLLVVEPGGTRREELVAVTEAAAATDTPLHGAVIVTCGRR
jgi:Mrp family chromosome partitioning ATPase